MNNLNLDKYIDIVNEEKNKRELKSFIPLYPMLRVIDDKLYVVVALTHEDDKVWDFNRNTKPEYWVLIDINSDEILEFNKTDDKDFIIGDVIEKREENNKLELSKYTVKKTLEYKNYLINDLKNEELPLQKKLSSILGNNIDIDGESVNLNEYLISNLESEINDKVNELVDILVNSKFGSYTYYYDKIFTKIIEDYKTNNTFDKESVNLCAEIMNNYYDGVYGINNLFNI